MLIISLIASIIVVNILLRVLVAITGASMLFMSVKTQLVAYFAGMVIIYNLFR